MNTILSTSSTVCGAMGYCLLTIVLITTTCCLPMVTAEEDHQHHYHHKKMPNFVAQDDLSDGEHEIRLHYNGVTAKQTSVDSQHGSERGLVVRQLSHHHHLLTMIYVGEVTEHTDSTNLALRDCQLTTDASQVDDFMNTFNQDMEVAQNMPAGSWSGPLYNVTFAHLHAETELPEYLRPMTNFRKLRAECKAHRRSVRHAKKAERHLERSKHHHQGSDDDNSHSRRTKRWILNELLVMPGTKWCGNKDLASSYNDLDGFVNADSCCRKHDSCPLNISGLERKYGLYNSHLTTISHCLCDERFKACLKQAHFKRSHHKKNKMGGRTEALTGAANLVGRLFFNVMNTQCFTFEVDKVCVKRRWWPWGSCMKWSIQKTAVLRTNSPF